jgi:hypothetical protein
MKKVILLAMFAVVSTCTFSQQEKASELSNAEKFSERSGSLIQKVYIELGTLKKCEIKVVNYTDLISNTKTAALKLEYAVATTYGSDTKVAVLDADEIDGLMKSIKIMQEKVMVSTPELYTEVSFRSRGGFEAGCFVSKDKWSTYLKLEKFDSKSYVFLEKEDLALLYTLLEQAKAKMVQ